jgi:predicted DNA-binding transcriptional regulator AlpA
MNDQQLAFTISQFCAAVPISRRTLYTLWERDQGPPRAVIGKRVLIPRHEAEKWLRAHIQPTT